MSTAKIIAKLVEAGHEDLAEQLLSGQEVHAAAKGETFPDSIVYIGTDGLRFVCKVQISWAGATIADAKRRLDQAEKSVLKATDKMLAAAKKDGGPTANHLVMDRSPAGPYIQGSEKYPHLHYVVTFWHYHSSFSPEQISDIDVLIKSAGLKRDHEGAN